ncbi:MAG: hypothetical protein V2J24_04320, partial [Pseudomonadales bacterium]|nr:hypothetical protein [Pseudomonadales bacterium]
MTPTNRSEAGDDGIDTIAPAEVTLARADGTPTASAPAGREEDRTAAAPLLVAIGGLVVVALLVFLVLPGAVQRDERAAPAADEAAAALRTERTPAAAAGTAEEVSVAPLEGLRVQRERRAAQEVLERFLNLGEALEGRAVERWGATEFGGANALAEDGDAAFLTQDYELAQALYRRALEALEALSEQGDALAAARLEAGFEAIEAGDAGRAAALFDFVLALDPDSDAGRRGAARAAVTDEVLDLVEEARLVAEDGALDAARGLLRQALDLDPESTPARTLATELDERLERADFLADMSAGYTALRARRFEEAEAAFVRAEAR